MRNKNVKQESFQAHFALFIHQGESDWEVRLIHQVVSVNDVIWGESYWQHKLETFQPNGLNEREVAFFNSTLFHTSKFILFSDKPSISLPI